MPARFNIRAADPAAVSVLQQEGKTVSPESAQTLAWLNGQK